MPLPRPAPVGLAVDAARHPWLPANRHVVGSDDRYRVRGFHASGRRALEPFQSGVFVHAERGAGAGQQQWLFWHPDIDPSVVRVHAEQVSPKTPGAFDWTRFARQADLLRDSLGTEWLLLTDAVGQIQLEIMQGTLSEGSVLLHFDVAGFHNLSPKLRTLSRLEALHRLGRFPRSLFPPEIGAGKWARALQAFDGHRAGASQREIAVALMGEAVVRDEWNGRSDFLRARIQRILRYGRKMADGGYRELLK